MGKSADERIRELEAALRGLALENRPNCWCEPMRPIEFYGHHPRCITARQALGLPLDPPPTFRERRAVAR